MWEKEEIVEMIERNKTLFENAFVDRKATDNEISKAEEILGFTIPEEYRWYLKEFGHGGNGFEFMGFGMTGRAIFVDETLEQRKRGLPQNLMVFQDCDEFFDCINVDDGSVVTWSAFDDAGIIESADCFCCFFYETVENVIINSQ